VRPRRGDCRSRNLHGRGRWDAGKRLHDRVGRVGGRLADPQRLSGGRKVGAAGAPCMDRPELIGVAPPILERGEVAARPRHARVAQERLRGVRALAAQRRWSRSV
jgi:hypothetical protein